VAVVAVNVVDANLNKGIIPSCTDISLTEISTSNYIGQFDRNDSWINAEHERMLILGVSPVCVLYTRNAKPDIPIPARSICA